MSRRSAALGSVLVVAATGLGCSASEDDPSRSVSERQTVGAAGTWTWSQSRITGGGLATQVAVSPLDNAQVAAGGDVWGLAQSADRGHEWFPALGGTIPYEPRQGRSYISGLAYSPKHAGTLYALTGKACDKGSPTVCNLGEVKGGFLRVEGSATSSHIAYVNDDPTVGAGDRKQSRHAQPRPLSRLLVSATSGDDVLYAGMGSGLGVKRSSDQGRTWQTVWAGISDDQVITGLAFTSSAETSIVVMVQGANGSAYDHYVVLDGVDGRLPAAVETRAYPAGTMFNEVVRAGASLFAVGKGGVWKSPDGKQAFQKISGSAFGAAEVSAIAGDGRTFFAGCTAAGGSGVPCLKKSTDGGVTWNELGATGLQYEVLGTTGAPWWHGGSDDPGSLPTGNGSVINQLALAHDFATSNSVYMVARGGPWKSEDGGAHWRPSNNGIGGSCTQEVGFSGGKLYVTDVDWNCFYGTVQQFQNGGFVHDQTGNACRGKTTVKQCSSFPCSDGDVSLSARTPTQNADVTLDVGGSSRSIANAWLRASILNPYAIMKVDSKTIVISGNEGLIIGKQQ